MQDSLLKCVVIQDQKGRGESMRRSACMLLLSIFIISPLIFSGCAETYHPGYIHEVGFRERAQSKSDEDVRVTVAVLSAEESKELFGVDLARKNIQPVWIRVENHDTRTYRLASTGLDPDYFSPLEVAYMHRKGFTKQARAQMERRFYHSAMPRQIPAGETRSGYVFTHASPGTKSFNVDIYSPAEDQSETSIQARPTR